MQMSLVVVVLVDEPAASGGVPWLDLPVVARILSLRVVAPSSLPVAATVGLAVAVVVVGGAAPGTTELSGGFLATGRFRRVGRLCFVAATTGAGTVVVADALPATMANATVSPFRTDAPWRTFHRKSWCPWGSSMGRDISIRRATMYCVGVATFTVCFCSLDIWRQFS